MSWDQLPKFMIFREDECADQRLFVMHTQAPRFLMEFRPRDEGEFLPIDPIDDDAAPRLRDEAQRFFNGALWRT